MSGCLHCQSAVGRARVSAGLAAGRLPGMDWTLQVEKAKTVHVHCLGSSLVLFHAARLTSGSACIGARNVNQGSALGYCPCKLLCHAKHRHSRPCHAAVCSTLCISWGISRRRSALLLQHAVHLGCLLWFLEHVCFTSVHDPTGSHKLLAAELSCNSCNKPSASTCSVPARIWPVWRGMDSTGMLSTPAEGASAWMR